jgi:hypothetical protein
MYIIPVAWLYVALMMAVAEATNSNGTVLGGLVTFVLYGLGPVLLVLYLMGSPARRKAIKAREAREAQEVAAAAPTLAEPNAGSHAPGAAQGNAVSPVRKEP